MSLGHIAKRNMAEAVPWPFYIIFYLLLLLHIYTEVSENFDNGFAGTNLNPGSVALSFYSGFFSFAGW